MTVKAGGPTPPGPAGRPIGVGMVGYAFMGRAHSLAWRNVNRFFDLPLTVDLAAVVGRTESSVAAAAAKLGWRTYETDWKALLAREDIGIIDVCTPGDSHAEIAIAALDAGKHVICEKPLANTVDEALAMTAAAQRGRARGLASMVAFNYRRVPAIALARQLIAAGRLGEIRHVRAQYLQDWVVDPDLPLGWRMRKELAGSGALGDIGAHIIDATQHVLGDQIIGVSGLIETFIKDRPLPPGGTGTGAGPFAGGRGEVTVDDFALFLTRFSGGAVGTFEATRVATGRKNSLRVEINGSAGSLAFDLEAMNELLFYDGTEDPATAGFRRILVTEPTHPYMAAWWPPGHVIGYEHTFTHETYEFLSAIANGTEPTPSFADGLQVQRVLAAVEESATAGSAWVPVDQRRD